MGRFAEIPAHLRRTATILTCTSFFRMAILRLSRIGILLYTKCTPFFRMAISYKVCLYLFFLLSIFDLTAVTVVYGDSRSQPEIHKQILAQIIPYKPQAVFHTGDMVSYGYRQKEFDELFTSLKPLTDFSKFYPVIGNHERNRELYFANFLQLNNQAYYVTVEDSIVWIALDSTIKISPGSPQYKWLTATLEQNKTRPMIILSHHPIFSSGTHGDELGLSFFLPALFKNYPILAVFSGHDHIYERSLFEKQWYIVTGGGGAPLYKANSRNDYSKKIYLGHNFCVLDFKHDKLDVKVYNLEGKLIDEFVSIFQAQAKQAVKQK